jgi:flavin reductase (DIM6/NTAB) family NADH-FMN oxidoreductase RutF
MSEQIATMLGKIPSGVFVLSARGPQGEETGMLASWVQQSGFEPPSVTVAVNKKRYLNDWLEPSAPVALSVVGEDAKPWFSHFGKGFDPGEPAFEGLTIERTPSGLPVLADALGWLEGTVTGTVDAGDHTIYVLQLTSAATNGSGERPYVHVRKNGMGY